MSQRESGIHVHEEWKGMTQPVGLVVEPIILDRLGIFPEKDLKVLSDLQRRLESLLEDQIKEDNFYSVVNNFKEFTKEVLDWEENDLLKPEDFYLKNKIEEIAVVLEDYGEILKPDWIVPEFNKEGTRNYVQILVKEIEIGSSFDEVIKNKDNKKHWEASPQQRFERLLKETENPVGILWNGVSLRLVYAPRGESSGHITFPFEPMISVDGRPIIGALEMLLGTDRLFEGGSSDLRLRKIMEQSRKEQNEVSTRLSEQVLEALWILVRGFDEAEKKANLIGKTFLNNLPDNDPSHIYGGLITVLLRLVFLLYSEDEDLMPNDNLYVQNYSVSGLAAKLRKERSEFQGAMDGRQGSWSTLLSLFRLVYDGGGPYEKYLPARHGELFDPDRYPFLEGRNIENEYKDSLIDNIPFINDDVVDRVLDKLLILDGQLLSYRSLDVEQIGSVYEGIMGFTVEQSKGQSIGVVYNPPRQKIKITYVFDADIFLSQPFSKRVSWLKKEAGVDLNLSSKIKKNLKEAHNIEEICQALENKLSPYTQRGLQRGNLILQPTEERRRSGSHYTPRTLTEPIVEEAFRPWLKNRNFEPSSEDILNLKICDPAMGSGAFLVATCRFLSDYLVRAWERDGYPSEFDETFDKDIYARRLVAQNCLYGIDKNFFAVSLAKLSLWLVTLSRDLPFTFLDHSLKFGDSLVGFSIKEINKAIQEIQLGLFSQNKEIINQLGILREEKFSADSRDDISYDNKKKFLDKQIEASNKIRIAGDLMVASFFNSKKIKEREEKQQVYLSMLNNQLDNLEVNKIISNLYAGDKGLKPFHWELEFPEVFNNIRNGFDVFIGNPPFAGKNTIIDGNLEGMLDWLKTIHEESHGNADLVSHFFRRCFSFLREDGVLGFIATNTISQGDTRSTGLRWICKNNGTIYSALKRYKWPGVASVTVSVVHIFKGHFVGSKKLDHQKVDQITAFLFTEGGHENPKLLKQNCGKSFIGSYVLGMGFTFSNAKNEDDDLPGSPSSLTKMEKLISANPINSEVIKPYIGGDDLNGSPIHLHSRYVIDFGEKDEDECREKWPELLNIIEKRVKPERLEMKDKGAKKYWWRFMRTRPELYRSLKSMSKVLVTTRVQTNWNPVFVNSEQVFSDSLVLFPLNGFKWFSALQSSVHEIWARFHGSSLQDALRYTPSDCFETFPFPLCLNHAENDDQYTEENNLLEKIGKKYSEFRSNLMQLDNQGLTEIYNRFHNPNEKSNDILDLRSLHKELDQAILNAYGWGDLSLDYCFSLDYLDLDDDIQLPDSLKKQINSSELFFQEIYDAITFEKQVQEFLGNHKKLPWRYRLPESTREIILSRLLNLNNDRYEEEIKLGLCINKKGKSKMRNIKSSTNSTLSKNIDEQIQLGFDV